MVHVRLYRFTRPHPTSSQRDTPAAQSADLPRSARARALRLHLSRSTLLRVSFDKRPRATLAAADQAGTSPQGRCRCCLRRRPRDQPAPFPAATRRSCMTSLPPAALKGAASTLRSSKTAVGRRV